MRTIVLAAGKADLAALNMKPHVKFGYHAKLLKASGFIEATMTTETGKGRYNPVIAGLPTLTWKGHDFLDAA